MKKIAVLVSGGGTNLGALLKAEQNGEIPDGKITLVVSSNPQAYALTRAKEAGVPSVVIDRKAMGDPAEFDRRLLAVLEKEDPDVIVLAGFMYILGQDFVRRFSGRILNVHPALIPSFCGEGYYGLRVHQAALKAGVKLTGATVHFVNEVADGGPILLQKAVEVRPDDTPEVLQRRVMEQAEWKILPRAVALLCAGKVEMKDGIAIVKEDER